VVSAKEVCLICFCHLAYPDMILTMERNDECVIVLYEEVVNLSLSVKNLLLKVEHRAPTCSMQFHRGQLLCPFAQKAHDSQAHNKSYYRT